MSVTERPAGGGYPIGELVFAVGLAALGAMTVVQARAINVPVSGSDVGPRAFPYVVGALLLALGIALVVQVVRGRTGRAEGGEDVDAEATTDWLTVGLLIAVIVVHIFLIVPLGWPVAAAVLFAGCAWILGARPWWRVAALGVVVALLIQWSFGGLLGVSLPPGPLLDGLGVFRG